MIPSTLPINIYADGLDFWKWAIPDVEIQPIILTTFGDWIYNTRTNGVQLLSIIDGSITKIGQSPEEVFIGLKEEKNRQDWLLEGFIYRCNAERLVFSMGDCLGWKLQPIIGGKFQFENIGVYNYKMYWHIAAQIIKQSRGIIA